MANFRGQEVFNNKSGPLTHAQLLQRINKAFTDAKEQNHNQASAIGVTINPKSFTTDMSTDNNETTGVCTWTVVVTSNDEHN
jgi:hypothetical protein